ncbi:MAG: hypothetical protein WDO24_01195 [Pseudomonadota bacterium]
MPFFVFYPLFIVIFGLNDLPIVAIGFLFAVIAMVISTLNGLDRIPAVLLKVGADPSARSAAHRVPDQAAGDRALSVHRREARGRLRLHRRDRR